MEIFTIFIIFGAIIFLGFLGDAVFKKTNIPDVLWLILFGIAINSIFNIDLASIGPITTIFTTFALIFILFEGALNTNVKYLVSGVPKGFLITILNFFFSVAAVTGLSMAFGLPFEQGLLFGTMIGGTSSAIIIPLVRRLKMEKGSALTLVVESAVSDVLCIIFAVTIINIIDLGIFNLSQTLNTLLSSFTIALVLGVLFGFIWLALLQRLGEYSKFYTITIAFLFVLYGVIEYIGASGAMAAFAFGIVLGNSKKVFNSMQKERKLMTPTKRQFYAEISFFLKSFFFVYIGLLITFKDYMTVLAALGIVLILFMIRPLVVFPISGNMPEKQKALLEVLIPKGLVAVVLAQLAVEKGISSAGKFMDMIPSIILFSIVFVTIFVFLVEKNKFLGFSDIYKKIYRCYKAKREKARKKKEQIEKRRKYYEKRRKELKRLKMSDIKQKSRKKKK